MKCRFLFVLLCFLPLSMAAQRRVVIFDLETKVPIRQARVRVDKARTFTTPYTGQVVLPEKFDTVVVSHPNYLTTGLSGSMVGDTIGLIPKAHTLTEVEVVADDLSKRLKQNVEEWGLMDKTESQLANPNESLVEFDIVKMLDFKGRARRKRTRKVKKALVEMENQEKDPIVKAYKDTVKPDEQQGSVAAEPATK